MKVGFAGAGNMAAAMARGWSVGEGGPEAMLFCDLDAGRARALAQELGGETRDGLADLARDSDVVLLAVKPGALDAAAQELGGRVRALISVLAATPVARLAEALPGVPLIRVMPSQPAQVRSGVLCYVKPQAMPLDLEEELLGLLGRLGTLVEVREEEIDAAMAVMSCTPAYFAMIAKALSEAGAREGLDPQVSGELVSRTMAGTAELLQVSDPDAVRTAVAPPGGATEAGLRALERGGVGTALADAVRASLERFR
jgi:pyrroline-5-carboxylate reductase